MTRKEFYANIIAGELNDEVLAIANKELAKLMPKAEDIAMRNEIVGLVGAKPVTAFEIAGLARYSKGKVSYALREAAERGELTISKVVNAWGSGAVNAYSRVETAEADEV